MASPLIQADIRGAIRTFRWNEGAFQRVIAGPHGAVGRDLTRRAIRVESAAKRHASGRPGPNVVTGRLRGSITWRLAEDSRGVYADVGTAVHYAPFVHAKYPFLTPALEAAR